MPVDADADALDEDAVDALEARDELDARVVVAAAPPLPLPSLSAPVSLETFHAARSAERRDRSRRPDCPFHPSHRITSSAHPARWTRGRALKAA